MRCGWPAAEDKVVSVVVLGSSSRGLLSSSGWAAGLEPFVACALAATACAWQASSAQTARRTDRIIAPPLIRPPYVRANPIASNQQPPFAKCAPNRDQGMNSKTTPQLPHDESPPSSLEPLNPAECAGRRLRANPFPASWQD